VRRYVTRDEVHSILTHCHSFEAGGYFGPLKTTHKVLWCGFYWPTIHADTHTFVATCDRCQRTRALSGR